MSQYLTFTLGERPYAVPILDVQEIRTYSPVTPLPGTPADVKGVTNLRGAIVPIVDLHERLTGTAATVTPVTAVVVVRVLGRTFGLVVDSVTDVFDVDARALLPAPDFGDSLDTRGITALAQAGDALVAVLDLASVLAHAAPAAAHAA